MRTLNPRNSINALYKKPEENKIQAHCQQRIENQWWMQNLKTAKQGAGCIQKELKHRDNNRVIVWGMEARREGKVFTVPKEMKQLL